MGKKTDRPFITQKEWVDDFGGKRVKLGDGNTNFRPLPFYACALSLQPFEDPVCTPEGTVYDILNIIPWLQKYKVDPINAKPLSAKELIPLHFHKNDAGKYQCPVTFKEFTEFSHIVAIKTSGNVYSWEAVEELNIKAKNWKDLLSDTPFTRPDIITIQDPKDLEKRNLSTFYHIRTGLKINEDKVDPLKNIQMSESQKKMLRDLNEKHEKESAERKEKDKEAIEKEKSTGQFQYLGASSASFTSTSFTSNEVKIDARFVPKRVSEKGYVRIHTNLGDLNLELHCDLAPKTCENFLGLCEKKYYDNTIFHRLKPGFMIQGGDPTGTGRGGESLWGKNFYDEFLPRLQHSARGIISMANTGRDTNRSQFFITFAPLSHLDNQNAVFGKVVGGHDTLAKMEVIKTDTQDRPLKDIKFISATVFKNPFKEDKEEQEKKKKEEEEEEVKKKEGAQRGKWFSNPVLGELPAPVKSGVGKYIKAPAPSNVNLSNSAENTKQTVIGTKRPAEAQLTKKTPEKKFGDFSSW